MNKPVRGWAMLLLLVAVITQADEVTVTVTGAVAHPGEQVLADGSRLAEPLLAAGLTDKAYPLAAAWERPGLVASQAAAKAGVVFDLHTLNKLARLRGNSELFAVSSRLLQRIETLPVTGRERASLLDPRPLEVSDKNRRLADGDQLYMPERPQQVMVLGAVDAPCRLDFVAQQQALDYLQQCPRSPVAAPDWLYVIQPDGVVSREGIGYWNRDVLSVLAPGALVYVPVADKWLTPELRDALNPELADFLATQRVPLAAQGGGAND